MSRKGSDFSLPFTAKVSNWCAIERRQLMINPHHAH